MRAAADRTDPTKSLLAATPLSEARAAVERAREAVAVPRPGAEAALLASLGVLAQRLAAVGNFRDAVIHASERVTILQGMPPEAPERADEHLAAALYELSFLQIMAREPRAAHLVRVQALNLWRGLAAADSARWSPLLFERLTQYAEFLRKIGERGEQLRMLREATAVARELARLDARRFRPELRHALQRLSNQLLYLVPTPGQRAEARALKREARGLALAVWRDRLRPW